MLHWIATLPWEGWSALASMATFVLGSVIAGYAARAAWVQANPEMQVEVETVPVAGLVDGFHVRLAITNITPRNVSLLSVMTMVPEWALMSNEPACILGHSTLLLTIDVAPHGTARVSFYLFAREGRPDSFLLGLHWSSTGPAGRALLTKIDGKHRLVARRSASLTGISSIEERIERHSGADVHAPALPDKSQGKT